MADISATGATGTTLQEYKTEIETGYLEIDPNWNIEPESPDGQAIAILSELLANLDEQVIYSYQSIDPNTAVSTQLDRIGDISGILRQDATFSTATVLFTGVNGTLIPEGTEVLNEVRGTTWSTDTDATIEDGTILVNVTCTESGAQAANVGELSSVSYPGVLSVTNPNAASLGRDLEPDEIYRVRRNSSVAKVGNNQIDSMISEIGNVDEVKRVKVYENFTSVIDANGLADHSMAIFVDGGDPDYIAEAMAATKNPGCGLNALSGFDNMIQVETFTPSGRPYTATFFRPELITIYVVVDIVGDGIDEDEVKQAIVDYANATLFNTESLGFDRTGFEISETISAGNLFTPVNSIVGSKGYVSSILISDDEYDVTQSVVEVGFNGLGVFDTDNIEVNIT